MAVSARFRPVDAAIIRVAPHSADGLPSWPDLSGDTPEPVPGWLDWLHQVWEHDALVEAIEVASPVLARRVADVRAGRVTRPRQIRRIIESVLRYVLRATSRATPFGLFAGIAVVRIGSVSSVQWGTRHRTAARPDAAWLAGVIRRVQARVDMLANLPVVANNLGFARGDRWVVECQPDSTDDDRIGEVAVRHTAAVQIVLDAARSPVTIGEVASRLATQSPKTPPAAPTAAPPSVWEHGPNAYSAAGCYVT